MGEKSKEHMERTSHSPCFTQKRKCENKKHASTNSTNVCKTRELGTERERERGECKQLYIYIILYYIILYYIILYYIILYYIILYYIILYYINICMY